MFSIIERSFKFSDNDFGFKIPKIAQWQAMAGYAHKWQQLPFVSYISLAETGFGESKVSKTDKQQAGKEALKQGVILLLVNLSGQ